MNAAGPEGEPFGEVARRRDGPSDAAPPDAALPDDVLPDAARREPGLADAAPRGEATGYVRVPWPVVAGALLALIVGALGVGLYANRNLRPQTAPVPVPTTVAAGALTPPVPLATPT